MIVMGRHSTIDKSKIFGMVGSHMAEHGSITLQDVVKKTGVSVGSLYHHYGSREALLAHVWIDAVTAYQDAFLSELESETDDAGERAAMATPQFCRAEPNRAKVLVCCRREELIASTLPDELKVHIQDINKRGAAGLKRFAKSRNYSLEACTLGLVAFPIGAVRIYLPHKEVPKSIDNYVRDAYRSAVSLRR